MRSRRSRGASARRLRPRTCPQSRCSCPLDRTRARVFPLGPGPGSGPQKSRHDNIPILSIARVHRPQGSPRGGHHRPSILFGSGAAAGTDLQLGPVALGRGTFPSGQLAPQTATACHLSDRFPRLRPDTRRTVSTKPLDADAEQSLQSLVLVQLPLPRLDP